MRLRDFRKLPNGSIVQTIPFSRANAIDKRLNVSFYHKDLVYGIYKDSYKEGRLGTINKEISSKSCFINGFLYPYYALRLIGEGDKQ
jgi:hypothetical protein